METGAARTISFQTICGLAVCNHETEQRNEKTGHNYAAGHLRSFKIEIRDTSRQLRRIKRKGGGLQNERRTSRGLWRCFDEIFEKFVCIPNKRHLADTWRDTIVFEDARACISLSILSNFNIVATSPGKICFLWNSARISITRYAKHVASHRASRNLVQRLHYKWRGKCIKYHPIVKLHFNYRKERVWRTLYIDHIIRIYTYIRGMYVSHISFPFNPFGLTIIWINSRREL